MFICGSFGSKISGFQYGTLKSNSVQLWHWSTSDMLGNECFAYRRAILFPLWAHNGTNSNTLKSIGETKSGCDNIEYVVLHVSLSYFEQLYVENRD